MRKWLGVALAGLVALACVATAQAETKYAVCVGINKYASSLGASTLYGCVNDAAYFYTNLVTRGGWQKSNMTLLTNSGAKKDAIRNAISNYAAKAVSGDTFIYQHSSHGGQNSGTSVFLCTYNDYYEDTEVAADLASFAKGVKVVMVVDACHSGGLFKDATRTKAPFNLAERVTAIMAENRAQRLARGERGVEKTLSASEIGWVTAADYTESSLDGGFYDMSGWMTSTNEGNVVGGVFLGAFTWAWWNGSCDTNSGYGDNDQYADPYECWAVARETCKNTKLWGSDAFTPQCTNTDVLRSVELGWVGDEEPGGVRFAAIPAQTATVGQALNYTVVATNSDGSTGKITYSVTSSTAPSGSYSVNSTSGAFTFTPATDGTFTFNFVGTNTTAHTGGKATMTVTANLAVPSSLSNSGISDTSFTANWAAVPGATSYFLEVFAADPDASSAAKAASDAFELVTSADELTAGEYVIVAANTNRAMNNTCSGDSGGYFSYETVTIDGSSISTDDASIIWTLEGDASSCTLFNAAAGKYANPAKTKTTGWSAAASGAWELELASGLVTAANTADTTWSLQYNASSPRFTCYDSKQQKLRFYRRDGASGALFSADVGNVTSYTVTDLIPGDYQWRVRAIGNAKGPFSELLDVTLNADPTAPPSIRPIADIDVTVGQPATATVAVSAPEEAPVTSVTITDGDPSATLQDGVFSFTPVYPNTYSFTITAVNANGTATESFTVTATLADPDQPATPATVGSDAFTAAWDPIPGAESYELDVVQGATSGGGGSGGGGSGGGGATGSLILDEDFSLVTTSNSTAISDFDSVTKTPGWSGTAVYPNLGMLKVGASKSVGSLQTPVLTVTGSVTIEWSAFSWPNDATAVKVGVSEDGGSTFTETSVALTESMDAYTTTFQVSGSSAVVQWAAPATKKRFYIDNIKIYSGSKARELSGTHLEGYPKNVGDVTSYIVSGLQPQTEYSFAIRAIAGDSVSEWSPAATVTTTEGPAAPAWSDIPAQTASIGYDFSIDLSAYVSGSPTPALTLTAGTAELNGTVLSFTPAAAQEYSFTVNASNDSGDADATFTVTAVEHQPTKYAVCVGINEYADINGLSGCVNDSLYMEANLLERGGWLAENVVRLNDKNATKDAIRSAISNVAAQAQAGDTFVYQHSSHGGQFNATEDDEDPLTGEEGKATFLCVYDEDYYDNTTAYNDYEIAADMAAFNAGVKVAVIVDACHSGGLFKSKDAAKASAASFDLAGRVTALMDADRTARKARGENVAKTLSSSEIGWATAAEYYEYSYDGGFYHTDEWLTNNVYGDEYYDEASEEYDYPPTYKQGGVFLASATWSWWNGTGDADADGLCDAYEFWQKGYDFCSVVGEFWYEDSTYNYYPQSTNIAVLKSIELGWIDDPRPAAPANPKASDVTASSFTASWDASENAVSYSLFVQKKVEAEAAPTARDGEEYQIDESFEGGEIPEGWTASSGVAIASGKGGDGTYCVAFKAAGATLVTPAVENPDGISFMYKRSNNQASWGLNIAVGPSAEGPWTPVDSLEGAQTTWQTFSAAIDASGTQYIKFTDARSDGGAERYIDLVQITGSSGTWEDVAGCAPASVAGLSKTVDGLDSDTDYRFWATAIDGEGVESADSAIVALHTLAADSAPVWSDIPELAAVAGEMGEFTASDYVTASPAATITLVSVTAPEGVTVSEGEDYEFEDGYLVFTPPAEGSYTFAFTAANDLGNANATLTVVAAGAPVTVPELTLSNPTATTFDADWTACTGASAYQFQVATDDQFTPASAGGTFTLVESDAGLTAGDYVILAADTDTAMNNTCSGDSSGNMGCTEVTVSGSTVSTEDADIIWTLAGDASSCTLFNADAGKFVNPATTRSCGWSDTASGSWTLSASDGVVSAANSASSKWKLQYNSGSPRFAMYESTQKNLRFFRRDSRSAKDGGSLVVDETMAELGCTVEDLTPETTYYARVRMADGEWSGVESITTLPDVPVAPEWLELPEQTATVGLEFGLDLSSYVTGSPFPVITVDGVEAVDGNWTFTPDEAGTFTFELVATNSEGSDSETLTVVVSEAPATIPVLTLSNPTASTFDAEWTACADAETYQFQVATDDQFTPGGGETAGAFTLVTSADGLTAGEYVILAEDDDVAMNNTYSSASTKYLSGTEVTVTGSTVSPEDASIIWTLAGTASSCTLFNDTAGKYVNPAAAKSLGWSDTASGSWTLSVDAEGIVTAANAADTSWMLQYNYNNGNPRFMCYSSNQKKLRFFRRDSRSAKDGGSLVVDETMPELGCTVENLDPETTYYARVRMSDGEWSGVESITTLSDSPTAPEWLDLPAQTATVGLEFGLDLSSYVTGSPFPAIYVDGVETVGGDWTFTPDVAGTFTFDLLASNEVGTATSTLTVVVSETPPAPVTVPVLTLSNPTMTTFDAAWTACDGATSYQFQVATDDQFTTGGGGEAILSEDFSGFTATNSNSDVSNQLDDYTAVSGWSGSKIYADAGRIKLGAGSGKGWIATPALNIPVGAVLTFSAAQYNKDTGTISANISMDDGETWTALANAFTLTTNASTFTVEFAEPFVNAKIQFIASVNRFYLDDVVISGAGGGETSVILDTTTADLSCTVEGLTPETTYYARVRMADGDWSEVKSIATTDGGSGGVVAVTGLAVEGNNLKLTLAGEATAVYGATELDENGGWMWEAIDVVIEGDTVTLPMDEPKMIYKVE